MESCFRKNAQGEIAIDKKPPIEIYISSKIEPTKISAKHPSIDSIFPQFIAYSKQ